jgi:hypothetical protein
VAFLLILDVLPSLGHSGGRRRSFVRYGNFTTWNPGGEHSGQYLRGLPALRSISNVSPHNAQYRCTITGLVYRNSCTGTPLRGEREIGGHVMGLRRKKKPGWREGNGATILHRSAGRRNVLSCCHAHTARGHPDRM